MSRPDYTFDTIHEYAGQELGVTDWYLIDQDRINAFADATLDHQWIHVDPEKAKAGPMGTTIAHGYLTLSLISRMIEDLDFLPSGVAMALNYGADKIRFISPVKVNSRVRDRAVLVSATPKGGGILIKVENTIEIEGEGKPAMIAETLSLIYPG